MSHKERIADKFIKKLEREERRRGEMRRKKFLGGYKRMH